MEDEDEATVTFTASGGGYDAEAEVTYTVGYFENVAVTEVEVEVTDRTAPVRSAATVTWDAPETRAVVEEYKVVSNDTGAEITIDGRTASATKLATGTPNFTVSVLFKGGTSFVTANAVDAGMAIV